MHLQISRYLKREWILFIAGGASNTLLTYAIFLSLRLFLDYRLSYLIAFLIGIGYSYVFNAMIVFRAPLSWRSFLAFPLVYVVQICLSMAGMEILVQLLHVSSTFAPLINVILVVPITFALSSRILAKPSERAATAAANRSSATR
ncbi:GtrA family protein [Tardiphaga sp. 862_B3_N1_1]|uniref:GtrA family protein n=1 Tax=Tardiphaga sp. 862_B3_N1_1 TaxID=3240763 RepID=UPI003F8BCB99